MRKPHSRFTLVGLTLLATFLVAGNAFAQPPLISEHNSFTKDTPISAEMETALKRESDYQIELILQNRHEREKYAIFLMAQAKKFQKDTWSTNSQDEIRLKEMRISAVSRVFGSANIAERDFFLAMFNIDPIITYIGRVILSFASGEKIDGAIYPNYSTGGSNQ